MRTVQGTTLESLHSVQSFLTHNAARLPVVVESGARLLLDETLASLKEHVTDQAGSRMAMRGTTLKQRALRRALLREHLTPIARVARIAKLTAIAPFTSSGGRNGVAAVPEVEPFKVPRGRPTAQKLAATAYGMAEAAAPFARVFTAAGLPQDFIARLTHAADALLVSLEQRDSSRGRQAGATAGIRWKLSTGRQLVHLLDAFVKIAAPNDPELLANWSTIKRVRRAPRRTTRLDAGATAPAVPTSSPDRVGDRATRTAAP